MRAELRKILLAERADPVSDKLSGIAVGLSRLGLQPENYQEPFDTDSLTEFSAVYFSGVFVTHSEEFENMAKTLCKQCSRFEIPTVFDPDLNRISGADYKTINEIAKLSDIFLPSVEDAKLLCGLDDPEKIAMYYLTLGTKKIVVKLDKKGAYYKSAKESGYMPTFRADKVVDTSGAGSAFAAGLISGITKEVPLGEAVVRANACGCIAIQAEGELESLPTIEILHEYMLSHRFMIEGCTEY